MGFAVVLPYAAALTITGAQEVRGALVVFGWRKYAAEHPEKRHEIALVTVTSRRDHATWYMRLAAPERKTAMESSIGGSYGSSHPAGGRLRSLFRVDVRAK